MSEQHEPDDRAFAEGFMRAYLRTPVPGSDARARVIQSAVEARRPRRAPLRLGAWLEPRTFTMRPITAAAAALVLIAGGALLSQRLRGGPVERSAGGVRAGMEQAAESRSVRFVLVTPTASRVALVGDFNGWDATATPMRHEPTGGVWSVTLPLSTGWHSYAFVVDGAQWIHDPEAPLAPPDDFGAPRSVVVVGENGV